MGQQRKQGIGQGSSHCWNDINHYRLWHTFSRIFYVHYCVGVLFVVGEGVNVNKLSNSLLASSRGPHCSGPNFEWCACISVASAAQWARYLLNAAAILELDQCAW